MSPTPSSSDTSSEISSETPSDAPQRDRFFGLSPAQVAGSGLAAATSALAASFLGVAGTLIGALVGSVVATIASAVYSHSFRRAGQRLRVMRPVPVSGSASSQPRVVSGPARREPRRSWRRVALGVVVGAALALGAITGIEGLLGHPISNSSGGGTSIGEALSGSGGSAPQRNGARTPVPASTSPAPGPTVTVTAPARSSEQVQPTAPSDGAAPSQSPTAPPTSGTPEPTPPARTVTDPPAPTTTPAP